MENMQDQMNAILGNPEMMQKIMSMAQALNQTQPNFQEAQQGNDSHEPTFPEIDLSMIQKLSGFAGKANIDSNQKTLLTALRPYLSHDRINKLEKAMRAAKLASMASVFLNNSGFLSNIGR